MLHPLLLAKSFAEEGLYHLIPPPFSGVVETVMKTPEKVASSPREKEQRAIFTLLPSAKEDGGNEANIGFTHSQRERSQTALLNAYDNVCWNLSTTKTFV